jgi:hypothetical protein
MGQFTAVQPDFSGEPVQETGVDETAQRLDDAVRLLARRLAPELQAHRAQAGVPDIERPNVLSNRATISNAMPPYRRSRTISWLLILLLTIALIPAIASGVMVWADYLRAAHALRLGPSERIPLDPWLSTTMPKQESSQPKQSAKLRAAAFSVPRIIKAEPSKNISFPIALDPPEAIPPRSIVAIRGLPAGTVFSNGRRYGETEWNVRPDNLRDLRLTLPKTSTGQRALSIELIAADGTTIATAATRLDVATKLRGATALRPAETEHINNLISHGQRMVDLGYFAGARAFFKRAAEAGSGEAALALGTTYDPALIAEIGAQGIEPEPREARIWYERAKDLGAQDAEAKLKALESATHETAASAIPETSVPATDDTSSETVPVSSERQEWIELSGAANLTVVPSSSAPDN